MSALSVAEVLERAADLLGGPGSWTKGTLARRVDGTPCRPLDPAAAQWCIAGAIQCVAPHEKTWTPFLDAVDRFLGAGCTYWNDHTAHGRRAVVTTLREAAKRASALDGRP